MSISYPTGFSEPSKCSRHKKMLGEYLLAEGREGERGAGRKGRRKEGREERGKKGKKDERKGGGGLQQLLTLHLLVCSRAELACFRKPPSPAPL